MTNTQSPAEAAAGFRRMAKEQRRLARDCELSELLASAAYWRGLAETYEAEAARCEQPQQRPGETIASLAYVVGACLCALWVGAMAAWGMV